MLRNSVKSATADVSGRGLRVLIAVKDATQFNSSVHLIPTVVMTMATIDWAAVAAGLHVLADLAVVAAVVIGSIELYGHRDERKAQTAERRAHTAAVDDHIRVLAIQARVLREVEGRGRSIGDIASRLVTRGSMPGDLMAMWLTAIAAEAPHASPALRPIASALANSFFEFAEYTEHLRTTFNRIPDDDRKLIDYIQRLEDLLRKAAPDEALAMPPDNRPPLTG